MALSKNDGFTISVTSHHIDGLDIYIYICIYVHVYRKNEMVCIWLIYNEFWARKNARDAEADFPFETPLIVIGAKEDRPSFTVRNSLSVTWWRRRIGQMDVESSGCFRWSSITLVNFRHKWIVVVIMVLAPLLRVAYMAHQLLYLLLISNIITKTRHSMR